MTKYIKPDSHNESLEGKNCIIYTRVSSRKQLIEFNGLENQKKSCEVFAEDKKMNIVKYFVDGGISGSIISREGLKSMISYIAEKNKKFTHIHYVLVDDIDRVMRDVQGRWDTVAKLETFGTRIYSLKQTLEDTPEGILNQNVVMAFKQYDRENNLRRTIDRQRGRLLNGYWCFAAPMGYGYTYANNLTEKGGRVLEKDYRVVDEKTGKQLWEVVRDGLVKLAEGKILNNTELAKYYYKYGLKKFSKKRNGITPKENKSEKTIIKGYLNFVGRFLSESNVYLLGGYLCHKDWEVFPLKANHTAIINEKTMNFLLERLGKKVKFYKDVSQKKIKKEVLLRQIIRCGHCKKPMTGSPSTGKLGVIYYYYTCRNKECSCPKSYNAKQVHLEVEEVLEGMSLNEDFLIMLKQIFTEERKEKEQSISVYISDKKGELFKISEQITKATNKLLNADNDALISVYEEKVIRLSEKKEELNKSINGISEFKSNTFNKLLSKSEKILRQPHSVWKIGTQDIKQKLVRVCFCDQIYYTKKRGLQTPQIPVVYTFKDGFLQSKDCRSGLAGLEPTTRGFGDRCSTN